MHSVPHSGSDTLTGKGALRRDKQGPNQHQAAGRCMRTEIRGLGPESCFSHLCLTMLNYVDAIIYLGLKIVIVNVLKSSNLTCQWKCGWIL